MKVGAKNRKQLAIMSALLALALVVFSRNVLNVGASAPAPVAEKTPALQEERGRQSASLHNSLDPSIRLDLLRSSESTEYKGNGRNIFTGPGFFQTDFALHKAIPIRERIKIEIRGEAFNVFNNVNFSQPTATLTSASFGVISSVRVPPRILQIAAKVTF